MSGGDEAAGSTPAAPASGRPRSATPDPGPAAPAPAPTLPTPLHDAGWSARLTLRYRAHGGRTLAHDRHEGPLRVLRALYPEGPAVCHHVLVHPPGGVAGGDRLAVEVDVGEGAHALVTTAGATRFYRSDGPAATQAARLRVAAGARLEWLPLETIAYPGCRAANTVQAVLDDGAEMIGWDLLALGLPGAGRDFAAGSGGWFDQEIAVAGLWRERGRVAAADALLRTAAAGWAGHGVAATLWFAAGGAVDEARLQRLLEQARARVEAEADAEADADADAPLRTRCGVTLLRPRDPRAGGAAVVLRLLAPRVEPALALLGAVRAAWRVAAWGAAPVAPRVWLGTGG